MNVVNYDVAGYDGFRERACDPDLTFNEKAGFPDDFRKGRSAQIFADICAKLPALQVAGTNFLEIGSGCGELGQYIADSCESLHIRYTVVDSPEVLCHIPERPNLTKRPGAFPIALKAVEHGTFDAILAYSVIQYVFAEGNIYDFVDSAIELLAPSGALLIGDIPNASMRKRFIGSPSSREYHRLHYSHLPHPEPKFNVLEPGQIDDAVMLGLVGRCRAAGLHAFIVPQQPELPMANRREDILIRRP